MLRRSIIKCFKPTRFLLNPIPPKQKHNIFINGKEVDLSKEEDVVKLLFTLGIVPRTFRNQIENKPIEKRFSIGRVVGNIADSVEGILTVISIILTTAFILGLICYSIYMIIEFIEKLVR